MSLDLLKVRRADATPNAIPVDSCHTETKIDTALERLAASMRECTLRLHNHTTVMMNLENATAQLQGCVDSQINLIRRLEGKSVMALAPPEHWRSPEDNRMEASL